MTWTLTILGRPATKGSTVSFAGRGGRIITRTDSARLVPWTDAVRWACREKGVRLAPPNVAVWVDLHVIVPRPRKPKGAEPTTRPDVDKLARAALDALTGFAYGDDSQVTTLMTSKSYGQSGESWQAIIRIEHRSKEDR